MVVPSGSTPSDDVQTLSKWLIYNGDIGSVEDNNVRDQVVKKMNPIMVIYFLIDKFCLRMKITRSKKTWDINLRKISILFVL